MSEEKKPPKTMPRGGRKGGSVFPRMNLETAVGYARRLVSKTHTGAQSKDVIYSGVFDATSSRGDVKLSALKQYGFVDGSSQEGFSASTAAKELAAAPPAELIKHYRIAVLSPKIFKALFETYHGDSVTPARLKQRAAGLNVHPDETQTCVDIYLESARLAELVVADGDSYRHLADSKVMLDTPKPDEAGSQTETGEAKEANPVVVPEADKERGDANGAEQKSNGVDRDDKGTSPRAIFNVNVTLDSSLDTDKLQKQLELLKRFGAI